MAVTNSSCILISLTCINFKGKSVLLVHLPKFAFVLFLNIYSVPTALSEFYESVSDGGCIGFSSTAMSSVYASNLFFPISGLIFLWWRSLSEDWGVMLLFRSFQLPMYQCYNRLNTRCKTPLNKRVTLNVQIWSKTRYRFTIFPARPMQIYQLYSSINFFSNWSCSQLC